jgi:outer membrane protein TolC
MKVEVRVASLEQELSKLRADHRVLLVQLGRLLGSDAEQAQAWRLAGKLEATPAAEPDMREAREAALHRRSELDAAKTQVERAKRALDAARSEHWPRVDGIARYGVRTGVPYRQADEPDRLDHEDTWAVGVAMDLPLFRGGAVEARVAQALLRVRQAEQARRDVELRIDEDLDGARTELVDSALRLRVTRQNVGVAAEAMRIEQVRFQEGRSTVNDVLDAQSAMLRAEVEYSRAAVDCLLARINWERAKGSDLPSFVAGRPEDQ